MYQYCAYSSVALKEGLAFRINLLTSLFGGFFRLILLISVWKAIYIGQNNLAGYNEQEILFYIIIAASLNAGGLLSVNPVLGDKIRTGDVVVELTKPVSLPWIYFFTGLGNFGLQLWIKTVPTLLIGIFIVRNIPSIHLQQLFCFLMLFIGGSFLHYWLDLGFKCFIFKTKSPYGIEMLWKAVKTFFTGLIVPIDFYPAYIKDIIFWTPFPSVAYIPIRILLSKEMIIGGFSKFYYKFMNIPLFLSFVMEQFTWIILVLPLVFFIYRFNTKIIEIQGG